MAKVSETPIDDATWDRVRIANPDVSCTYAAVLTGLAALGVGDIPDIGDGATELGAKTPASVPGFLDYIPSPLTSPLDRSIEEFARRRGVEVKARSSIRLRVPSKVKAPQAGEVVIAHCERGQESPGVRTWLGLDWQRPSTWLSGGHSVVVAGVLPGGAWRVVDSNHPGVQTWPEPGLRFCETRISLV